MLALTVDPWFMFLLGILAVWRVTHLLHAEDGPWDCLFLFRNWLGNSFFGKLFACFFCLSLWISAPAAWFLGKDWPVRILLWLALSAAAILVECAYTRIVAVYSEEPMNKEDDNDGMLRK